MKFRMKVNYATIAILAAILFAIIAVIFSGVSSTYGGSNGQAYGVTAIGTVVALTVIACIFAGVSFLMDCMLEPGKVNSIVADVLRIAAGALLIACFSLMVSERDILMGYIWFSDLEGQNASAVTALNMAVVSWIFYFLGTAACAVSVYGTFCHTQTKSSKAAKTGNAGNAGNTGKAGKAGKAGKTGRAGRTDGTCARCGR